MTLVEKLVYSVGCIMVIACLGAYLYHIWSDCLAENSILTCMRMLNK